MQNGSFVYTESKRSYQNLDFQPGSKTKAL